MMKKQFSFLLVFLILFGIQINQSRADIFIQSCNAVTKVCLSNLISKFFDEPIMFKTNMTDGEIKDIFFEYNDVPPFEKIFKFFPHLEHFAVENSDLKRMNRSDFVNATNLRALRIQYSKVEELQNGLFEMATSLQQIRLDHNKITVVSPNAFSGCSKVTVLSLQHNLIENISSVLFEPLTPLNYIDLSYNRIDKLDVNTFSKNPLLETILLNNNRITEFDSNIFNSLKRLDHLDVSFNVIVNIHLQSVNKLVATNAALKECHINGTIQELIVNNNFLKGVDIEDHRELKILEIHNNSVENLANFSSFYALENLDVSGNNLNDLNAGKLFNFPSLLTLKLAATGIKNLTDETFMFQNELTELDLSHNFLEHISSSFLEQIKKNLEKLNLAGNNLKSIDYKNLYNTHPNLVEINIQDNKWNCSYLADMIQYFQDNLVTIKTDFRYKNFRNKNHISGVICEDSPKVNESDLEEKLRSSNEFIVARDTLTETHTNRIEILILVIVVMLLILQVVKYVGSVVIRKPISLSRIRHRSSNTRLIEETEHL